MNDRRTINMADVARRAGVSTATVSRALRGVPGVSDRTRTRIRQVAEELSYVVSPEASQLARGHTGRVALVVPRLDVWFYSAMLAGMERVMRAAGLDVLVYQLDGEAERSHFFRTLPARRKVDAVVLVAMPVQAAEEQRLDLMGVQVVVVGGRLRDYPHVRVDDHRVGLLAVGHLLELGHRRIAMIRVRDNDGVRWSADAERTRGYRDALAAAGVAFRPEYVVSGPPGVMAGAEAVDLLLEMDDPPTAVFAYSDELAISALQRLHERRVRVPERLSVVGVDGHPSAELFGLTTVGQEVPDQARRAADLTVRLVRDGTAADASVVLDPQLVVRRTTAAI